MSGYIFVVDRTITPIEIQVTLAERMLDKIIKYMDTIGEQIAPRYIFDEYESRRYDVKRWQSHITLSEPNWQELFDMYRKLEEILPWWPNGLPRCIDVEGKYQIGAGYDKLIQEFQQVTPVVIIKDPRTGREQVRIWRGESTVQIQGLEVMPYARSETYNGELNPDSSDGKYDPYDICFIRTVFGFRMRDSWDELKGKTGDKLLLYRLDQLFFRSS